jgi:hypothetical protein
MWASGLHCFNAGTVLTSGVTAAARRNAEAVLDRWWQLTQVPQPLCNRTAMGSGVPVWGTKLQYELACPPYRGQWTLDRNWPGEQPAMGHIYADSMYSPHIQVGSTAPLRGGVGSIGTDGSLPEHLLGVRLYQWDERARWTDE